MNDLAPSLIHAETLSTLHELLWRGDIPDDMANLGRTRHRQMPVRIEEPPELSNEAWNVAGEFGWAKTYDAQYVALARLLKCRLVTINEKLHRGVTITYRFTRACNDRGGGFATQPVRVPVSCGRVQYFRKTPQNIKSRAKLLSTWDAAPPIPTSRSRMRR
jgi:predicted nucleic acid-binding protein